MSQLVACKIGKTVLLASDRRVEVRENGEVQVKSMKKLFRIGPRAALATGGAAAVGLSVSRGLAKIFEKRGAMHFEDLEQYVLSVFQKEYDNFVKQGSQWFADNPEALRRSCFLLVGADLDGTPRLAFHASDEHGQPYRPAPPTDVVVMPRRLGFEMGLQRAATDGAETKELKAIVLEGMEKIAKLDGAVGGPFDIAILGEGVVSFQTT